MNSHINEIDSFSKTAILDDLLGTVQKSISSRIAEFGRYGGRGFITNPLSVTEWNLTMFSIIFYKVSSLDNLKQRQKRPKKRFSLSTVEGF